MNARLARRLFSVDEYHRLVPAGVLSEDDRVELIEGELIEMPPIGSRHASVVDGLVELLIRRLGRERAWVRGQNPVVLTPRSEPRPDVAVVRPRADRYRQGHPGPEDVLLLIEVADTTAEPDRDVKVPLYARSGIAEVWLVDLAQGRVEVYREPREAGYASVTVLAPGDSVAPLAFPDVVLGVGDILA